MSHQAIAQVTARMRFDPSFVKAVYASPARALQGEELSEEEISWILAVDPRAWGTDPLLRSRTLRTLFEETRGASTLALAELRRMSALDAYFSSAQFHGALRSRGSMLLGYTAYLRSLHLRTPQLEPLLLLEETLAVCRRELELRPERLRGGGVARAAGVGAVALDGCTLEALNQVEQYLFAVSLLPAMALATDAPRLPPLPAPRPQAPLHLVVQPERGGSGLRELGRMVQEVLAALERPQPTAEALSQATRRGLSAERARGLFADLASDGLIEGW